MADDDNNAQVDAPEVTPVNPQPGDKDYGGNPLGDIGPNDPQPTVPKDPDEQYQEQSTNIWKQHHERSEYYRSKMDGIAKHFESQIQGINQLSQGVPQMPKLPTFDEYEAQHGGQQGNGVATKLLDHLGD